MFCPYYGSYKSRTKNPGDTFYFFNYSSVSKGSPEEWQNILGTLDGYVRAVVSVGNGVVAMAPNRSHPEYSALYFVTNSSPHGDWQAAVLGNLTSAAVIAAVTSIVALSDDILVVPDIGNGQGFPDDPPSTSTCVFQMLLHHLYPPIFWTFFPRLPCCGSVPEATASFTTCRQMPSAGKGRCKATRWD